MFPTEKSSVYYVPFSVQNGIKVGPAGKLWSHYNYVVGDLRKKGLLKRKKSSAASAEPNDSNQSSNSLPPGIYSFFKFHLFYLILQ